MNPASSKRPKYIVVTAGPTREKIDPVRFISNYSTGTFGYEIAGEARRRGHRVTLVSGPACLKRPAGVRRIMVESATEMRSALSGEFKKADCVIMAAAVSDWRPLSSRSRKMKRATGRKIVLEMAENPDILAGLGRKKGNKVLVGFALETEHMYTNALKKLREKNLDLIVANRCSKGGTAFGPGKTDIAIIDRRGGRTSARGRSKRELAKIILDKVLDRTYSGKL
ncbi:MAG: phosphopantothenoylcysteine decarboxylase [Candidatus Omnitrophota bacterium]